VRLPDRVYGPNLTLLVCEAAAKQGLPVYLFGTTDPMLALFAANLKAKFPALIIAGRRPSKFRRVSEAERDELLNDIRKSGAAITLVGLGCPRQEIWVYENAPRLEMPVLAVGAAFAFHAGVTAQAPGALQKLGLEWLFRLVHEPRRLWRRYVLLNPQFIYLLIKQKLKLGIFDVISPDSGPLPAEEKFG
jgi:exopolysaccharide biosynthesis WecB/TagA/CpsF family protein